MENALVQHRLPHMGTIQLMVGLASVTWKALPC
jgi:hypothetical protein